MAGIHRLKMSIPRQQTHVAGKIQSFDPIPPVARELAADAWLLCFDEFQV